MKASFVLLVLSVFVVAPELSAAPKHRPSPDLEMLLRWNTIAIDASGLDHTPPLPGENRVFREQLGPGRASRAMAIVHVAMFESMNAAEGKFESYTGLRTSSGPLSMPAAISQAAHDTLVSLYPAQAAGFHSLLAADLKKIKSKKQLANGVDLGKKSAQRILAMRAHDGAEHPEPFMDTEWITSDQPAHWRQDPISLIPLALGAHWGECIPFVVQSSHQFRAPPPPAMNSIQYAIAYDEVQRLGGDGIVTPTERTPEQTFIGIFWAYDGTPSLCAPPRLYNQITVQIADQMGSDAMETGRLLALVNVAMADAGMTIWESKYFYDLWRPITGIRESDPGTGATGLGDGNALTVGDPNFSPLGAPASNSGGPNFTPPFPSYPSGHAGFGGALFETLRKFYRTDNIHFTFVSDEFNGETLGNDGQVRPYLPRTFSSLSQAEEENGQSRIYLGIHWSFDKVMGIAQGNRVADYVFDHLYTPVKKKKSQKPGEH